MKCETCHLFLVMIQLNIALFLTTDPNRCANTIDALFKNAEDPDKVFVGLVEQNKDSEPSCIVKYCEKYGKDADDAPHVFPQCSIFLSIYTIKLTLPMHCIYSLIRSNLIRCKGRCPKEIF